MSCVYIAIGSNVGDRAAAIEHARAGLARLGALRLSQIHETPPVGGPAGQGAFLNAVAELDTTLEPRALLERLQQIEQAIGREPVHARQRWGPRVLDLDILFYEDRVLEEPGLHVPHPRLHERTFVLAPLAELAPDFVHPQRGQSVAQMLARLTPQR